MSEDRYVSTYVKDTRVEGYITYAGRRGLHIKILQPCAGITGRTVVIPDCIGPDKGYLDAEGYITKRGRSAAQRVLQEIYEGILFVKEKRESFLKLYNDYRRREYPLNEKELSEDEEMLYYSLFTYTITVYHRKISYDIFRQLVKKFVIKS